MSIQIRVLGLVASAIVASAASAQTAVEWKVSEGGNGHWYQGVRLAEPQALDSAQSYATARGGHVITLASQAESDFMVAIPGFGSLWMNEWVGPIIGLRTDGGLCEAGCWVTGESVSFTNWWPGNPDSPATDQCVFLFAGTSRWQNHPCGIDAWGVSPKSFIVEWDSDCNGDGIVDYGQILRGELQDDNQNGVPDICEYTVTGVIPVSGPAGGGTSIIVNGTNLPENPTVLVGGSPATNVVRVSPTRLTAVTPAGLPGMTSVTVGNWVQPNAFYYRPECGSDLDQNGTVDAGDISIILLDFGPCYEPPAALAVPAPTPLLVDEPAQKPVQR